VGEAATTQAATTGAVTGLTCAGRPLDTSLEAFGWLRDSTDAAGDPARLRARLEQDGYLYLPGLLPRELVAAARRRVCEVLSEEGLLDPARPVEDAVAVPGLDVKFRPDIANGPAREQVWRLLYGPEMMALFDDLLGAPARHYDFTWLRAVAPGQGTWPHCDIVFMGRGTPHLLTAWVPLGDVPLDVGGLVLAEGSHRDEQLRSAYGSLDYDTACSTDPARNELEAAGYLRSGPISADLPLLSRRMRARLLTSRFFAMGDLLVFNPFVVHGSLDNRSALIRLSTDSRYQRADEPADERWVGAQPPGHGGASVRDAIC